MGLFSGLLDGITITVKSPDGNLECELGDGRNVVMGFASGTYRRYPEAELSSVLTSLWAGHREAHLAMLREESGCYVRGQGSRVDGSSSRFTDARAEVRAEGRSPSGRVLVATTGLSTWQVRIKEDTVRLVDEDAFLNDVWGAFLA
ncbi:MAG: hypothetical protein ACRDTU_05035 [Micromonosporaceae bacterium]